jgi:hypothetical protein
MLRDGKRRGKVRTDMSVRTWNRRQFENNVFKDQAVSDH